MKLEIKNLSKTYENGIKALNNLNLTINSGMFGLLGPNGAGKSTLMRTIATLQEADQGEITFNGINVLTEKEKLKEILGYLPKISTIELLNHIAILKGLSNKNERKGIVNFLLNQVNLFKFRNKYVSSFSGGMKQRFGIAMALLGDPKLIIVDEPTAGLDPAERVRFNNLLSEISEDKVVILSTHIVDDVSDLCSDMAIINSGEVILNDKPANVMNELNGKIWEKIINKNDYSKYKDDFHIVYSHLNGGKPLIHVFSEDNPGNSFNQINPQLDDVYFMAINSVSN